MPHAEYPSASGCICRAEATFDKLFLSKYHNFNKDLPIPVKLGVPFWLVNNIENEPTRGESFLVRNLEEMFQLCAKSRVWGSMHFSKSIRDSDKLCKDIGQASFDLSQKLVGDADLNFQASS